MVTRATLIAALALATPATIAQDAQEEGAYTVRSGDATFTVERTIPLPAEPHGMAFSPDGRYAYVACTGADVIAVVDTETSRVVRELKAGRAPRDVILKPDGRALVATQSMSDSLIEIPLDGSAAKPLFDVSISPTLFSPVRRSMRYLVCEVGDKVYEVDHNGAPAGVWKTGARPRPADATSDAILLFVPNADSGTVTVFDTLNNRIAAEVPVGKQPEGGAVTNDDVFYIVAAGAADELLYINTASFEVVRRVRAGVGPRPVSIATLTGGRHAVVTNAAGASVSILDIEEGRIVGRLKVGGRPAVVREHPDGVRVFVSSEGDNTLSIIHARRKLVSPSTTAPTEVIVFGMIHGGHVTSERYGLDTLRHMVRAANPDEVFTEIPPNRLDAALAQWRSERRVEEPRVSRFPEYVEALFPLLDEMDFTIVPAAGWTVEMNTYRARALQAIEANSARARQMRAHSAAQAKMREMLAELGDGDDPRTIHTPAYDDAIDVGYMGPYNKYFNDDLHDGGWDNINAKHYALIEKRLDEINGQGKRVLITFGAAHKGWFLRKLHEREDVTIIDPLRFIEEGQRAVARQTAHAQ